VPPTERKALLYYPNGYVREREAHFNAENAGFQMKMALEMLERHKHLRASLSEAFSLFNPYL